MTPVARIAAALALASIVPVNAAANVAAAAPSSCSARAHPVTADAPSHADRSAPGPRVLTLDDLLKAKSVGDAWFSADGERVAFTITTSLSDVPASQGYDNPAARLRQQVYVADTASGSVCRITGEPGVSYDVAGRDPWMPGDEGLLLVASSGGAYRLALWSAVSQTVAPLPGRPSSANPLYAWADGRLVYAVTADGAAQPRVSLQMLEQLDEHWRAAWSGSSPMVTVHSAHPLVAASAPLRGGLLSVDPATGAAVELSAGDYGVLLVSPDGSRLAAFRYAETLAGSLTQLGARGELQLFDLSGDGVSLTRTFSELDMAFSHVRPGASAAWSPSGDRLLVGARPADEPGSPPGLYSIVVDSGAYVEVALPEGLSIRNPLAAYEGGVLPYGWIGKQPAAVLSRQNAMVRSDESDDGPRLDYGHAQGLRFDVYGFGEGGANNLTKFSPESVDGFLAPNGADLVLVVAGGALWRVVPGEEPHRLSPQDARVIAFAAPRRAPLSEAYRSDDRGERLALVELDEQGARHRVVLDLEAGTLAPLPGGGDILAVSPSLDMTVSETRGEHARLVVLNDGRERPLASLNAHLSGIEAGDVRHFTFEANGERLDGWVLLPPRTNSGVALPAVVSVYGGLVFGPQRPPAAAAIDYPLPQLNGQLLAAEGYAVIYPSLPLDAGSDTDMMSTMAAQAVGAVDALAAKGLVDPERVGVMGQSFGGYSTAAILSERPDRFRTGIAMAGVFDWMYAYGSPALSGLLTHDGRHQRALALMNGIENNQARLGEPFWRNPGAYVRNSPIFKVDDLDPPLLMLHGDLDGASGLAGATRMYNALVRAGKQPVLVRYWGEGHVADSAWAIRDQWRRIATWFRYHLDPPVLKERRSQPFR